MAIIYTHKPLNQTATTRGICISIGIHAPTYTSTSSRQRYVYERQQRLQKFRRSGTSLTRYAAESISLIIKVSRFNTLHGKVYYFMRLVTFLNKQAVRVATRCSHAHSLLVQKCNRRHDMPRPAPPAPPPRGRPSASRAAEQKQRSSSFPRTIRSYGHRCTCLTH